MLAIERYLTQKICFSKFDEATLNRLARASMQRLDDEVRSHGRRSACAIVERMLRLSQAYAGGVPDKPA